MSAAAGNAAAYLMPTCGSPVATTRGLAHVTDMLTLPDAAVYEVTHNHVITISLTAVFLLFVRLSIR